MSNVFTTIISGTGVYAVPTDDASLATASAGLASLLSFVPNLTFDSALAFVRDGDGGSGRTLNCLLTNVKLSGGICPSAANTQTMLTGIKNALLANPNISAVSIQEANLVDQSGGGTISFPGIQRTIFVDKGSNVVETGTVQQPYHSIQSGIAAASSGDLVLIYPGTYVEQIQAKTGVTVRGMDRYECILENTGVDASTYPLADSGNQEFKIENMTIRATDTVGVIHRLGNTATSTVMHDFTDVYFTAGAFEEISCQTGMKVHFLRCRNSGDANGFRMSGTLDSTLEIRFSEHVMDCSPLFQSDHSGGWGQIICFNATRPGDSTMTWTVDGDWNLASGACWLGGASGGISFGSTGSLNLYFCYLDGGVVFTSDPGSVEILNSIFNVIPGGRGDIDIAPGGPAQVVLSRYSGNAQQNGIPGTIVIPTSERNVGYDLPDRYMSLQDAVTSIIMHDSVIRMREDVALINPLVLNNYRLKIDGDGKHSLRGAPGFGNVIVRTSDNQYIEFENIEMSGRIEVDGIDSEVSLIHNASLYGSISLEGGDTDTTLRIDHAKVIGTDVYPYPIIFRHADPMVLIEDGSYVAGDNSGPGFEAVRWDVDNPHLHVKFSTVTHGSIGPGVNPFMRIFGPAPPTSYTSHHNAYNADPQVGGSFANLVPANRYDTYDPSVVY
jgi:hypothetical protein